MYGSSRPMAAIQLRKHGLGPVSYPTSVTTSSPSRPQVDAVTPSYPQWGPQWIWRHDRPWGWNPCRPSS